jgi:hypothetical protein
MATKTQLKTMTAEQLEGQLSILQDIFDNSLKAYNNANAKLQRDREALRKVQLEIESRQTLDFENALVARLPSGDNVKGMNWLEARTWKGDWKGTGLMYSGSYWPNTNQYCLTVRLNHQWDDAKLAETAKLIEDAIEVVKAGQFDDQAGDLKLMSKGSAVALNELKVLDIREYELSANADWKLALMPDDQWVIFDARNAGYTWGRARLVGSLVDCLGEIRQYLWAEGGEEPQEDY